MNLEIIAVDKSIFCGEVSEVTVPGSGGRFQILLDHAPVMSVLTKGEVVYVQDGVTHVWAIKHGVVSVEDNQVVILDRSREGS